MGCTYVKEFSFGGKASKPSASKGRVVEKSTGEVYANKKAMAKHERSESKAEKKAELSDKGKNKYAMGGQVTGGIVPDMPVTMRRGAPMNSPAPNQAPPMQQRPMPERGMPQRGVPTGGLTKFARGGGVPATSKEPLISAKKR
jgi:hypothetical protein